jgi:hypothetical protein
VSVVLSERLRSFEFEDDERAAYVL